jgi:superfamily II DNA or RNA helicase
MGQQGRSSRPRLALLDLNFLSVCDFMQVLFDPSSVDSYHTFLKIKSLPTFTIRGRVAEFPDEYADRIGVGSKLAIHSEYTAPDWMYDYQRFVSELAIRKRKFCMFIECGYGKTPIYFEFAKAAQSDLGNRRGTLIIAPLMVVRQMEQESRKFYGDSLPLEIVKAADLQKWLDGCGGKIGITNYDALKDDIRPGRLGCLIPDESSMLKSHYGKWGQTILRLGEGLEWKLAGTGTPAPNDRIEYANHAVFMDAFTTVNAFLATYFINRGQTQNRWEIKPHALKPFYRALSHWSIFLTNPATYGFKDNCGVIPPINVNIHRVDLTDDQTKAIGTKSGQLFVTNMGGITTRGAMGQIAKGNYKGQVIETNKPQFIADLIAEEPERSTIVWCIYDAEQDRVVKAIPGAASIDGQTPTEKRIEIIEAFQRGEIKTLVTKGKILGFGLNLQVCTRMVFSGLQDSYETYWQCIKRANRTGSTIPLDVHIPVTEIEEPMIETVLQKAKRVHADTEFQEQLFRSVSLTEFDR